MSGFNRLTAELTAANESLKYLNFEVKDSSRIASELKEKNCDLEESIRKAGKALDEAVEEKENLENEFRRQERVT